MSKGLARVLCEVHYHRATMAEIRLSGIMDVWGGIYLIFCPAIHNPISWNLSVENLHQRARSVGLAKAAALVRGFY